MSTDLTTLAERIADRLTRPLCDDLLVDRAHVLRMNWTRDDIVQEILAELQANERTHHETAVRSLKPKETRRGNCRTNSRPPFRTTGRSNRQTR